jgi:transposase
MTVHVGMDVHSQALPVAIVDAAGVPQRNRNLASDPAKLIPILGGLPPGTPVAFEAAYGWGWLVELLEELELEPHLVHPSRCKAIASARLKNDKVDAATLAQLLRARALLSIANSGPVIPPAQADRLFEPFQRLGDRTGHNDGHHGLGLSIVRAIATAHDATLTALLRPDGGLAVEVSFPLAEAHTIGTRLPRRRRQLADSSPTHQATARSPQGNRDRRDP